MSAEAPPVRKRKRARRGDGHYPSLGKRTEFSSRSPGMIAMKNGTPCTACGKHHRTRDGKQACNGHRRKSDPPKPCTNPPMDDTSVCRMHGGMSPHVQAKAEVRRLYLNIEGEVAQLLREFDLPDQHPLDGLLEVVRHTGGMMRLLGNLVAQLNLRPEHGIVKVGNSVVAGVSAGLYGPNHMGDAAPHVLVNLYEHWANMYARACKLALDANIDERLVRNAEATTGAVYTAIDVALKKAALNAEQLQVFSSTLGDELRKMVNPLEGKVVDV